MFFAIFTLTSYVIVYILNGVDGAYLHLREIKTLHFFQ